MDKIVVGYDGSDAAKRALDRAAALGRSGATVTVVTAVSLGVHGPKSMGAITGSELSEGRSLIDAARDQLAVQDVDAHAVEGEGEPGDVIIEAATSGGADLVIVGTRGLNAAQRLVLGSVSTKVVRAVPCDVLVVR